MPVRRARRSWRLLFVPILVWLLASGFAACGSPAGEPPPATTETPAPPAVPIESPAPAASALLPAPPAREEASAVPRTLVYDNLPLRVIWMTTPGRYTFPPPVGRATLPTCQKLVDCLEPVPGTFEHKTWEAGVHIDWSTGIFFMDTATGQVEGYRSGEPMSYWGFYTSPHGRWVYKMEPLLEPRYRLLLDRQTGRSWRWEQHWDLIAGSPQHLLFSLSHRDRPGGEYSDGGHIVVDENLQTVARFAIPREGSYSGFFSPDGRKVALNPRNKPAYLLDVETEQVAVLFDAQANAPHGYVEAIQPLRNGREILVTKVSYDECTDKRHVERYRFNWEGQELPWEHHWTDLSPDGRYVAWEEGGLSLDMGLPFGAWPSVVVVADVETGTPAFRVHSAALWYGDFLRGSRWLPSGDGILMRVRDGFAIAYVRPEPHLVSMPIAPDGWYGWSGPAPVPAPAGDDRFFSYGRLAVYDAVEDRWAMADIALPSAPGHHNPWGATDREMRFVLDHGGHGGALQHFAGAPRIEFPPFSNDVRFRVHGTASCLRLRTAPGTEADIAACLDDGTGVHLSQSQEWAESAEYQRHPSVALLFNEDWDIWVYVRTEDGIEGWVSHDYLELD